MEWVRGRLTHSHAPVCLYRFFCALLSFLASLCTIIQLCSPERSRSRHKVLLTQKIRLNTICHTDRENARDVWAAKGRKLEALFIMTTLMFACFIALLCEGRHTSTVTRDIPSAAKFESTYSSHLICTLLATPSSPQHRHTTVY